MITPKKAGIGALLALVPKLLFASGESAIVTPDLPSIEPPVTSLPDAGTNLPLPSLDASNSNQYQLPKLETPITSPEMAEQYFRQNIHPPVKTEEQIQAEAKAVQERQARDDARDKAQHEEARQERLYQHQLSREMAAAYSRLHLPSKPFDPKNPDLPKIAEPISVHEEGKIEERVIPRPPRKRANVPIELIVGGRASIPTYVLKNESYVPGFVVANGSYGGEVGLRLWYVGLTGNISARPNRNILDIREPIDEAMFPGIYGTVKGDLTNFLSVGGSFDIYIPFSDAFSWILSAGVGRESYVLRVEKRTEGPSGQIGIPEIDSPKDISQIYATLGMGPSVRIGKSRVGIGFIGGVQVPIKEGDAPWAINLKELAPYVDARASFYVGK